jgi:CBS-domain-containing membrane protein
MIVGGLLVFTTGNWSWLWEVLIGWFLWSAATRSVRLARLKDAVEGVTVREVMTERVPAIRADQSVRVGFAQSSAVPEAAEVAIIERDGRLVGVASRAALEEAARDRPETTAGEIASSPDEQQIIPPTASAAELVERLGRISDRLLLVVEEGALLGTVDPRALVAVVHRGATEKGAVLEP